MKLLRHRPSIATIVVALLLALLPVVAVFQYRWLGKVSEAERERLETSLRTAARELSDDFDRELARAYVSFGVDAASVAEGNWSDFARRYVAWSSSAPHPSLVSDIFLVRFDDERKPSLLRFDRDAHAFVAVAWDSRFDRYTVESSSEKVESLVFSHTTGGAVVAGEAKAAAERRADAIIAPLKFSPRFGPVEPTLPALVVPVDAFDKRELPDAPAAKGEATAFFVRRFPPPDLVVAVLDRSAIANEIVPELVTRHFGDESSREFDVGILDGSASTRPAFSTEPSLDAAAFAGSDITESFLEVSPDDLASVAAIRTPFPRDERVRVGRSSRFEVKVMQERSSVTPGDRIVVLSDQPGWQVAVRHRAGSLDAAVEAGRLRNLALSFGILLVLGGSAVMLVVSSQRAQRLARRQMEFVAGVSHELRTPLAVICSAAENLTHGVVASERQVKQYGALIEGEGRRLAEMVEQVLEYAGAASGKTRYSLRPVDVRELLESAVRASEPFVAEAGIELHTTIAERLPAIEGDPNALRRALQNLIGNAVKYGASGGVVDVSASTAAEGGARFVLLSVSDRGPGIDAVDIPHLFEPFYRGRSALDAQIHGSGLGLNLVKRVVEAHGGSVRVESAVGSGSTFTIRIPAGSPPRHEELVAERGAYEQAHPTR